MYIDELGWSSHTATDSRLIYAFYLLLVYIVYEV